MFGVLAALVDGGALRDRLSASASAADPAATEEAVRAAVTMTVLVVLGAVVTLAVLTLVWTLKLLRRKSWARTMLLITGLVTLFTADVGQGLVTGGAEVDRFLLLAQLPLVIVATGLLLARSSRAWLRGEDG